MTFEEFDRIQAELLKQVVGMNETKGREYAGIKDDRLANFKRVGEKFNVDPKLVCAIFLQKHLDSIDTFIASEKTFSDEKIEGRIVDAVTYMTLLWGLIVEQDQQNKRVFVF